MEKEVNRWEDMSHPQWLTLFHLLLIRYTEQHMFDRSGRDTTHLDVGLAPGSVSPVGYPHTSNTRSPRLDPVSPGHQIPGSHPHHRNLFFPPGYPPARRVHHARPAVHTRGPKVHDREQAWRGVHMVMTIPACARHPPSSSGE